MSHIFQSWNNLVIIHSLRSYYSNGTLHAITQLIGCSYNAAVLHGLYRSLVSYVNLNACLSALSRKSILYDTGQIAGILKSAKELTCLGIVCNLFLTVFSLLTKLFHLNLPTTYPSLCINRYSFIERTFALHKCIHLSVKVSKFL